MLRFVFYQNCPAGNIRQGSVLVGGWESFAERIGLRVIQQSLIPVGKARGGQMDSVTDYMVSDAVEGVHQVNPVTRFPEMKASSRSLPRRAAVPPARKQ